MVVKGIDSINKKENMGESVSGPRGSNRDIYPGRIH